MEHEQGRNIAVRIEKEDKLREKLIAFVAQVQKEEFWDKNRVEHLVLSLKRFFLKIWFFLIFICFILRNDLDNMEK